MTKRQNFSFSSKKQKEANKEFLKRRTNLLEKEQKAREILHRSGYRRETMEIFHFGLSDRYIDKKKIIREKALVAPVMNERGIPLSKSVYFNLPGITVNPLDENCWFKGAALTYYSKESNYQSSVFVCSSIKDLWLLSQFLNGTPLESEILFIASSQNDTFPEEWYSDEFWKSFERVFLSFPSSVEGDKSALAISKIGGKISKRIFPPGEADATWKMFCRDEDSNYESFLKILDEAKTVEPKFNSKQNEIAPGRFGYQPVDIAGAFHNCFLYYPAKTLTNVLENYRDEAGHSVSQISSKTEIVLVRSDRTIQTVTQIPAPRGTPLNERVLRLSDGTLIESHPKASLHSTWSWNSIQSFCSGKSKSRHLGAILGDVKNFLKNSVWLPYPHDYDLLTLLVPVTFAQAIFQSVPLILVTGPPSSGKSSLGKAMMKICANATTVGQISAAAAVRLIDETKGFVVFDDLEAIGKKKCRDGGNFSELVQSLKLSYNKQTSWKTWTDVSRGMTTKRLNFYGVKMINNTTGADHILGSRLLKVYMQKIPLSLQQNFGVDEVWNPVVLSVLRDELHTWVFENVGLIDETYRRVFSFVSDRYAEITAPLKVFAEIADDTRLIKGLDRALAFQNSISDSSADPVGLMKKAIKRLVLSGYTSLSPTHISLEMKHLALENPAFIYDEHREWQNIIWLGRHLRSQGLINVNAPTKRNWLHGKSLRTYDLNENFVTEVLNEYGRDQTVEPQSAVGFCSACNECKYGNLNCSIRDSRYGKKDVRLKFG